MWWPRVLVSAQLQHCTQTSDRLCVTGLTYPGGAPISLLTLCLSIYSLISMRTRALSSSNKKSARDLASSVLPSYIRGNDMATVSECLLATSVLSVQTAAVSVSE